MPKKDYVPDYVPKWDAYNLPKNTIDSDGGMPAQKQLNDFYTYSGSPQLIHSGQGLDGYDITTPAGQPHSIMHENLDYSGQAGRVFNGLKNVINGLSNEEIRTANPNIKGNLLYGYGNPALSYDGSEYPYDPDADERIMPDNQDTLMWHLLENGFGNEVANFEDWTTPEQRDELAREFTLLRNASDYSRQRALDQAAEEYKQRNLYGDTLVDLLQNTAKGQSILDYIPAKDHQSRQRNITGQGTGAFIK